MPLNENIDHVIEEFTKFGIIDYAAVVLLRKKNPEDVRSMIYIAFVQIACWESRKGLVNKSAINI